MATYAVTSVVVSVIAFTFSHRAEMQRMQLQQLADHDPLTGIPNRRAMVRELGIAAACRRGIGPSGLLVLDLDHFKRVNDAFGHEADDSVLVDLVRLVTRSTRQSDRFFRYGGEEFVLLLHGSDVHSLRRSANPCARAPSTSCAMATSA